ncbi:MAG: helix-turn-helix transcriptional regulator [Acidimicrobiia bacterium]
MVDRLERLVNLTATLLDTRRPLSLEELADRVEPRYPDDLAARRRQFERDKETLRELGVPISVETLDGFGAEQGYRIKPSDYYLPALDLDDAELAALHVAVTAVRFEGGAGLDALAKLGGRAGEGAATALAELAVEPLVPALFDAVRKRASLTFDHRGSERHIDPYGVVLRYGHWYVVGHDRDRNAPRAFRVDRIEGAPVAGRPGAFDPPHDVDAGAMVRERLTYGDDRRVDARVLVDATRAALVVDELGDDAVVTRHDDGAVEVVLRVVNPEAFRGWVLDLLEHAEVLEPPELRADLVAWLTALVSA